MASRTLRSVPTPGREACERDPSVRAFMAMLEIQKLAGEIGCLREMTSQGRALSIASRLAEHIDAVAVQANDDLGEVYKELLRARRASHKDAREGEPHV
jgi:hypothetical protein